MPTTKNDLSPAQAKLIADRESWMLLYTKAVTRKNRFAVKLQEAGRSTDTSKKYAEMDADVKKYHTLLRESLPAYKQIFKN